MRRSLAAVVTASAVATFLVPGIGNAEDATAAPIPAGPAADAAAPTPPAPPAPPSPGESAVGAPAGAQAPISAAPAATAAPPPPEAAPATGVQEARRAPEPDPILGADPLAAGSTAVPLPPGARTFIAPNGLDPLSAASTASASAAVKAPAAATAAALPPPPPPPAQDRERKPWRTLPLIGFNFGFGFPDLANANLVVRPINMVRLYAGPSWGYVAWGMQGGVTLSPINWYINPTLSFQAGKLFRIDASKYVKDEVDSDGTVNRFSPLAKRVDFHYYAGDLGLELGSPRSFSFFLKLGLSFVVIKANGTGSSTKTDGTMMSISNPKISAWAPSAKFGFQFWF